MLLPFWYYYIQKNWDCRITEEMAETNIFCYGKKKKNRPVFIAEDCLRKAIKENRSVVLYAKDITKFNPILLAAFAKGVRIVNAEATLRLACVKECEGPITQDVFQHWESTVANICDPLELDLLEKPTIIVFANHNFEERFQYTNVDKVIEKLNDQLQDQYAGIKAQVILDDLCGNMMVRTNWLNNQCIRFCITTVADVASEYWRKTTAQEFCDHLLYECDVLQGPSRQNLNSFVLDSNHHIDYALHKFFRPIETVMCIGVDGVKPKDHKEFVAHAIFNQNAINLSGKFCIEERTARKKVLTATLLNPSNAKQCEISDDIEQTGYAELANRFIVEGDWIIEVNGRMLIVVEDGNYIPATVNSLTEVKHWIEVQLRDQGIRPIEKSESPGLLYYIIPWQSVCPLNSNEKMFSAADYYAYQSSKTLRSASDTYEIAVTKVTRNDLQTLRMNYLINVLEINELRANAFELMDELDNSMGENWQLRMTCNEFYDRLDEFMKNKATKLEEEPRLVAEQKPDYIWQPYEKETESDIPEEQIEVDPFEVLPQKGILFLGGHQNMTKKLKQVFPDWTYISDDLLREANLSTVKIIFYWANHSSHTMRQFVNARKSADVSYIYVSAKNINLLVNEMAEKYMATMKDAI